jgi:hypothetical protein
MAAGADDYRRSPEPPRPAVARTQTVNLGCGTLILIALIFLFFSQGGTHEVEQQLLGVRSEVAELKKSVDALRARDKADVVGQVDKGPASPYCAVARFDQHDMNNGIKLKTWDLKAHGLKTLSVRLVEITAGKAKVVNDTSYEWNAWAKSDPEAAGFLLLLARPDQGKVVYSLSVDIKNSPGHARRSTPGEATIAASLNAAFHGARTVPAPIIEKRPVILMSELLVPAGDLKGWSTDGQIESLTKATEGGRAAIALTLEWTPQ